MDHILQFEKHCFNSLKGNKYKVGEMRQCTASVAELSSASRIDKGWSEKETGDIQKTNIGGSRGSGISKS
jgi:hypothetical protein